MLTLCAGHDYSHHRWGTRGIEAAGIPKGGLALILHPASNSVLERGILYMCYAYFLSLAQSILWKYSFPMDWYLTLPENIFKLPVQRGWVTANMQGSWRPADQVLCLQSPCTFHQTHCFSKCKTPQGCCPGCSGKLKRTTCHPLAEPIVHKRTDKYSKHTLLLHNISGLHSGGEEATAASFHIITRQVSKDDVNGTEDEGQVFPMWSAVDKTNASAAGKADLVTLQKPHLPCTCCDQAEGQQGGAGAHGHSFPSQGDIKYRVSCPAFPRSALWLMALVLQESPEVRSLLTLSTTNTRARRRGFPRHKGKRRERKPPPKAWTNNKQAEIWF